MHIHMGSTTWIFADLTPSTECQIYQQQRPTLNPQYGTIFRGDQPATYERLTILEHFHCGTLSLRIDSCVGMGLPFLHITCLSKLVFTEGLPHHHGIPHDTASDQRTVFIVREEQQCDHTHRPNSHWVSVSSGCRQPLLVL